MRHLEQYLIYIKSTIKEIRYSNIYVYSELDQNQRWKGIPIKKATVTQSKENVIESFSW